MNGQYYTIGEVAYLYGVSESLVRKWIWNGSLKAVEIPDIYNDTQYYKGVPVCRNPHAIAIPRKELDCFIPNLSEHSVRILMAKHSKQQRDYDEYMDWLDRREQALYDEIEFIQKVKTYIKEVEPYL